MKMKKCPQCKNLVSVTAPTCLYCGRPNRFVTDNYVKRKWDKEHKKNIFKILISKKLLLFLLFLLIILFIFLFK